MAPYTLEVVRHLIWQRRIFLTLNIVAAISMGILAYFVHQQSKTIQDERRASIRRSCQDQNARHDKTIQILDQQIDKLPPDRKARAERSKQFTILLINALAPKQDCNKIVKLSVHS